MINSKDLLDLLNSCGINYFSGVADSTLGSFLSHLESREDIKHRRAVNEGLAVASAAGYYLATSQSPCVYLQNSGLGNAINALSSLTDEEVYDIPLVLLVGWRGEPGVDDEPQHTRMGKITTQLLLSLGFDLIYISTRSTVSECKRNITELITTKKRVALLVSRGIFDQKTKENGVVHISEKPTSREVIRSIVRSTQHADFIFSNTGYASRDLHAISVEEGRPICNNFYGIGSMGHVGSLAYEFAKYTDSRRIVVIDGDGSFLMHLGMIAHVDKQKPCNFIHIVLDNKSYFSTGGQTSPSNMFSIKEFLEKSMGDSYINGLASLKKVLSDEYEKVQYCYIETNDYPQNPTPRNKIPPSKHKELFLVEVNRGKSKC